MLARDNTIGRQICSTPHCFVCKIERRRIMSRQFHTGQRYIGIFAAFCVANIISAYSPLAASDLSERLWGGRGSQTTTTDLYVPPPLTTETISVPMTDATGITSAQTQLMIGTPGAMTLPPGGVIASNGVATTMPNGVVNAGYIWPQQAPIATGIVPASQLTTVQPAIEFEWSYSTIKDVTYEPVSAYDPRLGGYVTTYQEKKTESVLPWLHRKQVVRYKPDSTNVVTDTISGTPSSPTIGSTILPLATPTMSTGSSERSIVYRLFPVSTVPSPPAQAVPVTVMPMMPNPPMVTYASDTVSYTTLTPVTSSDVTTQILPTTLDQTSLIASDHANVAPSLPSASSPNSSSSSVISPSTQQVLYPIPLKNESATTSTANNTLYSTPVSSQTSTPEPVTTSPMAGSSHAAQRNTPTLAPPKSENSVVQPTRLQDSLTNLKAEMPHVVALPSNAPLPVPTTVSSAQDVQPASALAETQQTTTTSPQPVRVQRTTTGRSGTSMSPTRMSSLFE